MEDINQDAVLTRAKAAAALTERGYLITVGALATLAVRGGGPPYHRFGRRALYRWDQLLRWAHNRVEPKGGSSENANERAA
jgi:hypothetical protein